MSDDTPWFSPTHKPGIPRQRKAGEEVWRLHDHAGQVLTCEVFDQTEAGAGFDVVVLLGGEPHFSCRCLDGERAAYTAEALWKANVRGGWRKLDHSK